MNLKQDKVTAEISFKVAFVSRNGAKCATRRSCGVATNSDWLRSCMIISVLRGKGRKGLGLISQPHSPCFNPIWGCSSMPGCTLLYLVSEQVSSRGWAWAAGLVRICSSSPTKIAQNSLDGNKPLHHLWCRSPHGMLCFTPSSCDVLFLLYPCPSRLSLCEG